MVADHASEHIVHRLYLSKALGLDGIFFGGGGGSQRWISLTKPPEGNKSKNIP